MSRLINADDILSRAHDVTLKNGAKHRCFDVTMLHEIPTVETLEWIPCSERLPKIGQYCFITTKDGDVNMDKYCSYGWRNYGDNVLAWMELPEPYEESKA